MDLKTLNNILKNKILIKKLFYFPEMWIKIFNFHNFSKVIYLKDNYGLLVKILIITF